MKRALVTGGSGIIGSAICRELAEEGLHILVHGHRNPDQAQKVVEELHSLGHSAESVCFDVTDREASLAVLEKVLSDGPVQVIVNNAGIHQDAPLAGMSPEQWNSVIQVILTGFYNVTQPLLLPMIRTRWGRIVSISSLSGVIGNRGQTNYAAAKAGLLGASKSLSMEVASRGITVNVVAPGIIDSPETNQVISEDRIQEWVPMKRKGTPEEVAYATRFLVSERASYISGQILNVNGGIC